MSQAPHLSKLAKLPLLPPPARGMGRVGSLEVHGPMALGLQFKQDAVVVMRCLRTNHKFQSSPERPVLFVAVSIGQPSELRAVRQRGSPDTKMMLVSLSSCPPQ